MSSRTAPTILLIGTLDTKRDEVEFLRQQIRALGARDLVMDVGVLGAQAGRADIAASEVAAAAGVSLQAVMDSGDENTAMTLMAQGASLIATRLRAEGRIDGMLALGGTMGTDLALDVAHALPLGVPKVVLSTIAYSHLIPPDRIPPDLIMRLWAGGLYGLNRLCRAALAQAAGAVVGACQAVLPPPAARPLVGMTSLGSSALKYMTWLKPALEERGYELAVFHTTGMGGRAFEDLARRGSFVAVMDFSLQELANELAGSCVTAGADRLRGAGQAGVPQLVAPGATDMVDFPAWQAPPARWADRPVHAHNRLIASVCVDPAFRREVAHDLGQRLAQARGPVCVLLPEQGIEEWDRPGAPLHDAEGLAALCQALPQALGTEVTLQTVAAHINDPAFAQAALAQFDAWVAEGVIPPGAPA